MTIVEHEINRLHSRLGTRRISRAMNRTIEALRRLTLVCGSTGDALLDFEEQATAFEAATGKMPPGKDVPAACAGSGATREEYADWVDGEVDAARAVLIRHDKGEL